MNGQKRAIDYLTHLYDQTKARAEHYAKLLGISEEQTRILQSQLFYEEVKKIPIEEFDKLIATKRDIEKEMNNKEE